MDTDTMSKPESLELCAEDLMPSWVSEIGLAKTLPSTTDHGNDWDGERRGRGDNKRGRDGREQGFKRAGAYGNDDRRQGGRGGGATVVVVTGGRAPGTGKTAARNARKISFPKSSLLPSQLLRRSPL